jgi:restriction system protein
MALWLVRAGKQGEFESRFLKDNRIYATWNEFPVDLSKCKTKHEILDLLQKAQKYSGEKINTLRNWMAQLWMFAHEMKPGDWVVLPSKYGSSDFLVQ